MAEDKKELELSEEERAAEAERFISHGEDVEVLSEPQCVGCIHNLGMLKCAALATKPTEYLTNVMECPMKETK